MKRITLVTILMFGACFAQAASHYNLTLSTNAKQVQVSLFYIIKAVRPDAVSLKDFILQNNMDGKGPYIKEWINGECPTKEEIESNLVAGYALQVESINRPNKINALWEIIDSEESTDRQKLTALIKLLKLKFRRQ